MRTEISIDSFQNVSMFHFGNVSFEKKIDHFREFF